MIESRIFEQDYHFLRYSLLLCNAEILYQNVVNSCVLEMCYTWTWFDHFEKGLQSWGSV